ncbi:MAG: hypothetical protein WCH21_08385, partial [Bacteroidota bacterium]
ELLSRMLRQKQIPHNVLNAKQHAREAQVVAEAGFAGAVTIATNMAGRGTDIVLGGNLEMLVADEVSKNQESRKLESKKSKDSSLIIDSNIHDSIKLCPITFALI